MALDIDRKLSECRGAIPPRFPYDMLTLFGAVPNSRKMKLEIVDNVGVKKIKGPFIVLSNHTSRCDWQYIGLALYPHRLNFVASNIEFHRAHMHGVFDIMHVIPKKNFVPDLHCIREILQITRKDGSVLLFPEGKSSISGTNQPVMPGTAQLLKKLNIPVYATRISGGYLSNTQWYIKDRPGKVVITVEKLFTPEETQTLSPEEMTSRVNAAIYNDDFVWNREQRVAYADMDDICHKLETHLFWCPKCGAEIAMKGEGSRFVCEKCGNGMTVDALYDLHPLDESCVIPKDLRVWYELQRRKIYREIRDDPDFRLEEIVTLGIQPTDHYVDKHVTAEVVGSGVMTLTRSEFTFTGTKNGEPFSFSKKTAAMPTLVMETDSTYFGGFFDDVYYEFTPERPVITKWLIAAEECHRLAGGKWQNVLPQQQWIYADDTPEDREKYYL